MKKIYTAIVFLVAFFVFAGCTPTSNTEIFNSTKEVYAFEAVSSMSLLQSIDTGSTQTLSLKQNFYEARNLGYSDEVTEEEITEINKYLGIMEQLLSDDDPISVLEETSDRVEYSNKLVISTKDINLDTYTYTLYYNEELLNEVDDEEDDEDDDDFDEVESSLEGVMVINDKEYTVIGKKEIEEDEMKVEFTSKIDDDNWVKVVQKTEDDEKKFIYTISEAGVVSETKMKFEVEDDETKLKLEFSQGEIDSKYEFKIEEEDGEKVIKIKIFNQETELEVKVLVVVDSVTNEVTYEYRVKDSNKVFNRNRGFDNDDDDDELDD